MKDFMLNILSVSDLRNYNEELAVKTIQEIYARIENIQQFPYMGAALAKRVSFRTDYKYVICGNYVVLYKIGEEYVEIYRMMNRYQDITKIFQSKSRSIEEHKIGGTSMKLKNVLIVVKDIEKSKQFYHDLFGLNVVLDNDGNMILTEGLVLQEEKIWRNFLGKEIVSESNACELYFEERDIEAFVQKLEKLYPSVQYVNRLMTDSWGQKVVRFYDLDGNLIEVGTPM